MCYNGGMRRHRLWLLFYCTLLFVPSTAFTQTILRISLENSADHVQTRAVQRFATELEEQTEGRLRVEVHHSGTLSRDQDVFAALQRGSVDMAVPGTWHISRFEPAVAVFLLPHFFGRDGSYVHEHSDGELGSLLTEKIQQNLAVVIPGRWLDLGPGHLYFRDRQVHSHWQLDDLNIRVAGGPGNELRIAALGATPLIVPWNEVPQRLQSGVIDGLLTTHETVRSGQLWLYGVTHALEDFQYFPQYVPMIRQSFWRQISAEDQQIIRSVWEGIVTWQRTEAARAQWQARQILTRQGIHIQTLPRSELQTIRDQLMLQQDEIARRLGIPPEVLALVRD